MRQIKIPTTAAIAVMCLLLMACKGKTDNSSQMSTTTAIETVDGNSMLRDSLDMAREYIKLFNEVSEGLNDIKRMEQIVSSVNLNSETSEKKDQMLNDIMLIKNSIQDRQRRLLELEQKLSSAEATNSYNENDRKSMLQTISNLKQQLEDQQTRIDNLTAKLEAANATINDLNNKVDSLSSANSSVTAENSRIREENQRSNEEVTRLTNQQNECFYAIGSKKELKNHKIIDTGFLRKTKVMQSSNIMHSYFTKADKRTLNEIPLHSKKAKVLTNHDPSSYTIEDVNGMKVLKITNKDLFWKYTNYLVVQVD